MESMEYMDMSLILSEHFKSGLWEGMQPFQAPSGALSNTLVGDSSYILIVAVEPDRDLVRGEGDTEIMRPQGNLPEDAKLGIFLPNCQST